MIEGRLRGVGTIWRGDADGVLSCTSPSTILISICQSPSLLHQRNHRSRSRSTIPFPGLIMVSSLRAVSSLVSLSALATSSAFVAPGEDDKEGCTTCSDTICISPVLQHDVCCCNKHERTHVLRVGCAWYTSTGVHDYIVPIYAVRKPRWDILCRNRKTSDVPRLLPLLLVDPVMFGPLTTSALCSFPCGVQCAAFSECTNPTNHNFPGRLLCP